MKGQFLKPEEIREMQNEWLRQWFKFMELYKTVKL